MLHRKYEILTDLSTFVGLTKVFRIRSLRDFGRVREGELGGYIKDESNLSHDGNAWIYDRAYVFDQARVDKNAEVYDCASIYHNAVISDNAKVSGYASIFNNASVYGNSVVSGYAWIYGDAQIFQTAKVRQNACILGNAQIFGDALVGGNASIRGTIKLYRQTQSDNQVLQIPTLFRSKKKNARSLPLSY